jgi:7,8-dihydro-6-hydroxymethylpterin-pyrophosphokinase
LDLLFYGQHVIRDTNLMIPHPELHNRRFVLEPLCEIASYFIHPSYGISVRGLMDRLVDKKSVERIKK